MLVLNFLRTPKALLKALLIGDWLIIILSLVGIFYLFQSLWTNEHATKVQITVGNKIYATYSLNQQRDIHIHG